MNSKSFAPDRPCWPLVWLWIISIAQYAYRYILQVNDPRTTNYYDATPPALSAIKYAILLCYLCYAAYRFTMRPVRFTARYAAIAQISLYSLLLLVAILICRIAFYPGDLEETYLCATQLLPWIASALLIPFLVAPDHSVKATLVAFERVAFWLTFSFWLITVCLVFADVRYPALSYPGVIVRFGGILDDPNGYACLCLLLAMLAFGLRERAWALRTFIYGIMIAGTLSLTGYATAGLTICVMLVFRAYRSKKGITQWLLLASLAAAVALVAFTVLPAIYSLNNALESLGELYSTKGNSAATHIADLLPAAGTLEESSVAGMLVGNGGFSENLYWRVLANFGVIGLFLVAGLAGLWCYVSVRTEERWQRSLSAWTIGVLIGSNGIAYLLSFPLGLLFWSTCGFLLYTSASHSDAGLRRTAIPAV